MLIKILPALNIIKTVDSVPQNVQILVLNFKQCGNLIHIACRVFV
jgi:hypothetical protein